MKTVLLNTIVFVFVVILAVASFQWRDLADEIKIQPAWKMTPTLVQPSATSAPTNTVAPTSTPSLTPVPSPTINLTAVKAAEEIRHEARRIDLELDRQELQILRDRLMTWALFVFACCAFVVGAFAFGNASVKTWVALLKSAKPASTGLCANTQPTQPENDDNLPEIPSCDEKTLLKWIKLIDEKTGKTPAEAVAQDLFKTEDSSGQKEYRAFFHWLILKKFVQKTALGWVVTPEFYEWIKE